MSKQKKEVKKHNKYQALSALFMQEIRYTNKASPFYQTVGQFHLAVNKLILEKKDEKNDSYQNALDKLYQDLIKNYRSEAFYHQYGCEISDKSYSGSWALTIATIAACTATFICESPNIHSSIALGESAGIYLLITFLAAMFMRHVSEYLIAKALEAYYSPEADSEKEKNMITSYFNSNSNSMGYVFDLIQHCHENKNNWKFNEESAKQKRK